MKPLVTLIAVILSVGCASISPAPTASGPRLYHYIRSSSDGALPENIWVYQATRDRVDVLKIVERCANAAYVTAELDLARGQPRALLGGRLTREGAQAPFAWLSYEPTNRTLDVNVPDLGVSDTATLQQEPWILYDFDLADLTGLRAGAPAPRTNFSLAVALIWPEREADPLLDLGVAEAEFIAEEIRMESALRFRLAGALTGDLWLDADEGHVIEARFDQANHGGYADFHLVLQRVETVAAAARWEQIRLGHWEGCAD